MSSGRRLPLSRSDWFWFQEVSPPVVWGTFRESFKVYNRNLKLFFVPHFRGSPTLLHLQLPNTSFHSDSNRYRRLIDRLLKWFPVNFHSADVSLCLCQLLSSLWCYTTVTDSLWSSWARQLILVSQIADGLRLIAFSVFIPEEGKGGTSEEVFISERISFPPVLFLKCCEFKYGALILSMSFTKAEK